MSSRDYRSTRDLIAAGHRVLAAVDACAPGALRHAVYADRNLVMLPSLAKDWMVERLVGLTHRVTRELRAQLGTAEELVDAAGAPSDLRESADWLDARVAERADRLAPLIRVDKLEATQEGAWSGSGALLYRSAVDGQDAAVLRVSEAGRSNAKVLRDAAAALDGFVGSMTLQVLGIVAAALSLMGALAALVSASHYLIVVVSFAAAVVSAVVSVGSAIGTVQSTLVTMSSLVRESKADIVAWPDARFGDAG